MLTSILAIAIGFLLLMWSADRFVFGAAAIAKNLGMSTLMIGLTIVALGTSAPEILVSTMASLEGSPGIAIGNAVGSNIANIGLVLGVSVMIAPLTVTVGVQKKELPALLLVTLLVGVLLYNGVLGVADGLILLGVLAAILILLIRNSKASGDLIPKEELEEIKETEEVSILKASSWFLVALLVLLGSSRLLVWGATNVARDLGVDETIIGLTIVAIGTSLPELAASIASAIKKHHDIALGNVVGSNILNMLTVLPVPALLAPGPIPAGVFERDYAFMLGITVLTALSIYAIGRRGIIHRWQGASFSLIYLGYLGYLYMETIGMI